MSASRGTAGEAREEDLIETVSFSTEDGVDLEGTLYGRGDMAVLLAPQADAGFDRSAWEPFARRLAERGYAALAFGFRGAGAAAETIERSTLDLDAAAATAFLRCRGFSRLLCVGAGSGGMACLSLAERAGYAGLIVFIGRTEARGAASPAPGADILSRLTVPTLIVSARGDSAPVPTDNGADTRSAPGETSFLALSGEGEGVELLESSDGRRLAREMLDFIDGVRDRFAAPDLAYRARGPGGPVYGLAWSPDGRTLASTGFGRYGIWEPREADDPAARTAGESFAWGIAWSPDGALLATASQGGETALWKAATGTKVASLPTGWAFCAAWSPDGTRLAAGTRDGRLLVWDAASKVLERKAALPTMIICLAWSPDGGEIAAGRWDGAISVYDAESLEEKETLVATGYRSDVNGLAWSPDGRTLAAAQQDGAVRLWSARSGRQLGSLAASPGWLRGLAWSPDGSLVAAAGEDATIRVWRTGDGSLVSRWRPTTRPVWALAWSPDGRFLAASDGVYEDRSVDGEILVFDLATRRALIGRSIAAAAPAGRPVFSPDSAGRATCLAALVLPGFEKGRTSQCEVAFSRDDRYLAVSAGVGPARLWDLETGGRRDYGDACGQAIACAFSPDGESFAFAGLDGAIRLGHRADVAAAPIVGRHAGPAWDLCFAPDGRSILSAGFSDELRRLDLASGRILWSFPGRGAFLSVAVSPDGRFAAYGGLGGEAGVLEAETGSPILDLLDSPCPVGDVAWSPSGDRLAAATDEGRVYVWSREPDDGSGNLSFGEPIALTGHAGFVNGVAFSPDGDLLATGGHDGKVGLWDPRTGQALAFLEGHADAVLRPAFSRDGRELATPSWDGTVRIWGIEAR